MPDFATNELLLRQVAAGDRDAFRALYASTSHMLFAICVSLLKDRAAAEDVLQEAFVRVWANAGSFDHSKGSAATWLVVLTRRLALNELRRRQNAGRLCDDEVAGIESIAAELPADDPIGKGRLTHCLGRLNETQRQSVLLAYVHGYTSEELARRFDRPLGTVKSWLKRGLDDLKKCIG